MSKKQGRAIIELIFGLALGIPSIEDIFSGIFLEMFRGGNYLAIIGLTASLFVGLILTYDSIAIALGFKNLGDLFEYFGYEED